MDIHIGLLLGLLVAGTVVCGAWKPAKWLAISVALVVLVPLGLLLAVVR